MAGSWTVRENCVRRKIKHGNMIESKLEEDAETFSEEVMLEIRRK